MPLERQHLDDDDSERPRDASSPPAAAPSLPSLDSLMERYKGASLSVASARLRAEFLTRAALGGFTLYAGDASLRFEVSDDAGGDGVPTAAIDLKTGRVYIGKSLLLACLDGQRDGDAVFNHRLLTFVVAHEIGHFQDQYGTTDKPVGFSQKLRRWKEWTETLDARVWTKWHEIDPEASPTKEEVAEDPDLSSPLHGLYFRFFNQLDDPVVNSRARRGMQSVHEHRAALRKVYDEVLFGNTTDARGPLLSSQLGSALLQAMERSGTDITVDPRVQAELDATYTFGKQTLTLAGILSSLVDDPQGYYAAIRYTGVYTRFFIPAFERLLALDAEEHKERVKEQQPGGPGRKKKKKGDQEGEGEGGGEGEPGEGKPKKGGKGRSGGTQNPFRSQSEDIGDAIDPASKNDVGKVRGQKAANEQAAKSDAERAKDALAKFAGKFAGDHGLSMEKTQRFLDIVAERLEDIENLADYIVQVLIRNKLETRTDLEPRRKSGKMSIQELLKRYAGVIASDDEAKRFYERRVSFDAVRPRQIRLTLRLLIDNSGSMAGLVPQLDELVAILGKALQRAQQRIVAETGIPSTMLRMPVLLFDVGTNVVREDAQEQVLTEEQQDAELIAALSKIVGNGGTDDADIWEQTTTSLFNEQEVSVQEDAESISIAIEVTDGYTSQNDVTRAHVERAEELGIRTFCAVLDNDQALDVSEAEATHGIQEQLHAAVVAKDLARIRELTMELDRETEDYRIANKAKLAGCTVAGAFGDRVKRVGSASGIIPLFMVLLMRAVNEIDAKLGLDPAFSPSAHFTNLDTIIPPNTHPTLP